MSTNHTTAPTAAALAAVIRYVPIAGMYKVVFAPRHAALAARDPYLTADAGRAVMAAFHAHVTTGAPYIIHKSVPAFRRRELYAAGAVDAD